MFTFLSLTADQHVNLKGVWVNGKRQEEVLIAIVEIVVVSKKFLS